MAFLKSFYNLELNEEDRESEKEQESKTRLMFESKKEAIEYIKSENQFTFH